MFCKKCGEEIEDGFAFCTKCGAPQNTEAPDTRENVPAPADDNKPVPVPMPVRGAEKGPSSLPVFILGIVTAALALEFGIGAVVCGIICRIKVKQYTEAGGELTGKAKIGNILGLVGLIVGIVTTVISVVTALGYIFVSLIYGIGAIGQNISGGVSVFDKLIDLINRIMDYSAQKQSITFFTGI